MPNLKPLIKPITTLTKAQWKAIVSRVMEREGKAPAGILRVMADDLHSGSITPDQVIKVGELGVPTQSGIKTTRYPIEEARAKYFSNPDAYIPGGGAPEMSQVSVNPRTMPPEVTQEMIPEGMAADIAMSRVKQVPVVPSGLAKTRRSIEKDYMAQETEQLLSNQGVNIEDIRPNVNPERVLAERGIKINKNNIPPVGQLTQAALLADQLWKDIVGGGRSSGAKVWELYRKSSRQSSHIANSRDYFISSFTRWKDNPAKFTKNYPREAKLLNQLWAQYEASLVPKGGGR